MDRMLKAFGLALAAAFALSAVAASGAFAADEFVTPGRAGITHLTGTQYTEGNTKNIHGGLLKGAQEFQAETNGKKTVRCNTLTAKGTVEGEKNKEVTVTPEYGNCGVWVTNSKEETVEEASATVEFTTCHYLLKGETKVFSQPEHTNGEHATVNIHCDTPGDVVHIKVTGLKINCFTLPEQSIEQGVRYFKHEPTGQKKAVVIHATSHGIISKEAGSIACPGTTERKTGTYTGEITVKGFEDEAHTKQVDIEVSGAGLT